MNVNQLTKIILAWELFESTERPEPSSAWRYSAQRGSQTKHISDPPADGQIAVNQPKADRLGEFIRLPAEILIMSYIKLTNFFYSIIIFVWQKLKNLLN